MTTGLRMETEPSARTDWHTINEVDEGVTTAGCLFKANEYLAMPDSSPPANGERPEIAESGSSSVVSRTGSRAKKEAIGREFDLALDRGGNLNDAAYKEMRKALMDGRFAPGQAFSIRALAAAFGTSPMPIREALKRLLSERALEMRRNRSVVLPVMSRQRFQEILYVRLKIEPELTAIATKNIEIRTIEEMTSDHHHMCDAKANREILKYLSHNRSFHFRLYEAAKSVMLLPLVENLWTQVGPHLHHVLRLINPAPEQAEHLHYAVLQALRRKDSAAASEAIWKDIANGADLILAENIFGSANGDE